MFLFLADPLCILQKISQFLSISVSLYFNNNGICLLTPAECKGVLITVILIKGKRNNDLLQINQSSHFSLILL